MGSDPSAAGRILVVLSILLALVGCGRKEKRVSVEQPIAFSHKKHFEYFSSGKHREEKLRMHFELLEIESEEEAPALGKGKCLACHKDLAEEVPLCAGCHTLFQDSALRANKEIRPCVACHRMAWVGYQATIPSATVCRDCHGEKARTDSAEEERLRGYFARNEDIPWMQIHTVDPHVHFSHKAHVRYAGQPCTRCHTDVRQEDAPLGVVAIPSMEWCVECHEENGVKSDCLDCHK
ncbi:MAG: cytochrome c3 family protein [Planctomycetes bacterium]|nr:cytochrome c3 family protein [Planctomycetota bacterium]